MAQKSKAKEIYILGNNLTDIFCDEYLKDRQLDNKKKFKINLIEHQDVNVCRLF